MYDRALYRTAVTMLSRFDGIAPTTTTELTKQSHKARERRTDLTVSGVCSGFGFVRSKRYMNSFGELRPHGRERERRGEGTPVHFVDLLSFSNVPVFVSLPTQRKRSYQQQAVTRDKQQQQQFASSRLPLLH